MRDSLYGVPGALRFPFVIHSRGARQLIEFPMTTARSAAATCRSGGGAYLRLLPYAYMRWGMRRVNREGQPAIVYLHPWELDPEQPRLQEPRQARVLDPLHEPRLDGGQAAPSPHRLPLRARPRGPGERGWLPADRPVHDEVEQAHDMTRNLRHEHDATTRPHHHPGGLPLPAAVPAHGTAPSPRRTSSGSRSCPALMPKQTWATTMRDHLAALRTDAVPPPVASATPLAAVSAIVGARCPLPELLLGRRGRRALRCAALETHSVNSEGRTSSSSAPLDLDLVISINASQKFKSEILALPRLGCINVHGALLPRYRGRLPSFWVLANGEKETGTTVHFMNEEPRRRADPPPGARPDRARRHPGLASSARPRRRAPA